MAAVLGIVTGGVAHVFLAALGVGLLLSIYPVAFNALLVLGSVYIVYIGWSLWRGAGALGEVNRLQLRSAWQTFWRGAATCLMNPKAYVFMVAVFPQFVRPAYGSLITQAIVMGLIISTIQCIVYGAMAWGAGGLQGWLNHNRTAQVMVGRGVGVLLILAAAFTGIHGWRQMA
jgi:threonine/homoserine/homoserine lactone efflux protein